MRTLKKTLCLVLALALCFSLASVAFASNLDSYTDAESVTYTEAVDVLMGMGIVKGDTETTINPQGDLTREQAAKLVTYAAVGATVADKLAAANDPFDDVAATRWSAGYISYCVAQGIINGDGNGKFRPTDNVTGYEFAKMMLCVLGYGKNDEYTGKSWSVNVAKDALSSNINLFKDVLVAANNEPINREEAFQVVFNTITGPETVVFSKDTESYKDANANAVNTLATTVFGLTGTGTSDDFGRPITVYTNAAGKTVATVTEDPVITFTSAKTEKEVFDAVGATGIQGAYAKYIVMDEIYINGVLQGKAQEIGTSGQYQAVATGTADSTVIVAKNDASNAAGFGNGVTVELYATATANHYVMVSYNQYISTVSNVTAANENTGAKRTITITGAGTFATDSYEKQDVVLYTVANGVVKTVATPETVTGKVTKIVNNSVYTIGGAEYVLSQDNTAAIGGALSLTVGTEGTWYLDSNGNIIAIKTAAPTATYYGVVLNYASQDYSAAGLITGATAAAEKFSIVTSDGETVVLDGAFTTNANGTVNKFVADASGSASAALSTVTLSQGAQTTLVSYKLNSKGEISEITASANAGTVLAATVTKGSATITNIAGKGTDKTIYFLFDAAGKFAVYTGYTNVPTKTSTTGASLAANGKLNAVALKVSDVGAVSAKSYVYFASDNYTAEQDETGTTTYTYSVYVDGATSTVKFAASQGSVAGKVYEFTTSTTTGLSTLGTNIVTDVTAGTAITDLQSTYFVATNEYYTTSSTVYYEIDTTNGTMTKVDAITALSATGAYTVKALYTDGTADNASAPASVVFFTVG
jgi:hypothetical protein